MEIRKIYIEAKKSKNFQTYTVGLEVSSDTNISEEQIKEVQAKCRKLVQEQIKIDGV